MDKIRVLIADDHAIVRMGLAALLETSPDIEVVDEARNGELAIQKALKFKPDIVILDLLMPIIDGIAATKAICDQLPETKVLVLTTSTVSDDLNRALVNGASGIVIKSSENDRLIQAIHQVAEGKRYIPTDVAKLIDQDPPALNLTDRQLNILQAAARGFSSTAIGKSFGISEVMVKKHLTAVFRKLGASNRAEAISIAMRKNLLKREDAMP